MQGGCQDRQPHWLAAPAGRRLRPKAADIRCAGRNTTCIRIGISSAVKCGLKTATVSTPRNRGLPHPAQPWPAPLTSHQLRAADGGLEAQRLAAEVHAAERSAERGSHCVPLGPVSAAAMCVCPSVEIASQGLRAGSSSLSVGGRLCPAGSPTPACTPRRLPLSTTLKGWNGD